MTIRLIDVKNDQSDSGASTQEITRNLSMTTKTMTLMYEEVEGAIVSYLEVIGKINTDRDFIIETDLGIALNEDGLVELDITTIPVEQLEFDFTCNQ